MRVLVVCTANQCRSPMLAALLEALAPPALGLQVSSAGTLAAEGEPATPQVQRVMGRRGLDLGDHRSRALLAEEVAGADLVLVMERRHVRDVVLTEPGAWPRTFTVPELVRRGERVGPRRSGEDLGRWLERVGEGRGATDAVGLEPDDEVADPVGRSRWRHERTARQLEDLATRVLALLGPPGPPPEEPGGAADQPR